LRKERWCAKKKALLLLQNVCKGGAQSDLEHSVVIVSVETGHDAVLAFFTK
jgi:hypothetical protein